MFGGGGRVEECTAGEVKALLIAGTTIVAVMLAVSCFSGQPECFLWPVRAFVVVWLVAVWWKGIKRLKELKGNT
jgi:hypothetical protein